MSWTGEIALRWGDGEHSFRLGLGQLRELQEKTGHGPASLMRRLVDRTWHVDDARETIRLGLIGAGMTPVDALKLVERYVDGRPLIESIDPALRIIEAALLPPEDDALGKPTAEEGEVTGSPSPASTAPAH